MNLINLENISKIYGDKVLFDKANVGIQSEDKIGIVGVNGTGKTTFLRLLAGEEEPDEGLISRQNNLKMSYLHQNPTFGEGKSISEYIEESQADPWKIQSILGKLGITEYDVLIDTLSGGQKRRLALARTLAEDFDVLILDEPTNHLDGEMISWLEEYLRNYRGVLIMVTHDRYFLDKVCNRILEISHGSIYSYKSDYSGFLELKAAREESELASMRKRNSILRMELEWAKRGCRARSTKQKARLERLEELKKVTGPAVNGTVLMDTVQARMGKKTIELEHISKRFDSKFILNDVSYIVLKNQRLGLVGPNGCGKSTLIKIIAGKVQPDEGQVELGQTIRIAYLAQEETEMDESMRVIDYIKDIAEYITTSEGKISATMMLERFLFSSDMMYSPIGKLSGGEKRRLYLLGILCTPSNVLLLDEPNNNLDIPTMTILEEFLQEYQGIIITVSHDRYFLDNVVDRILEFDGFGNLRQYEGGYTDYIEAKEVKNPVAAGSVQKAETGNKGSDKDWKKHSKKLKFTYKEQQEYDTIDDTIERLEQKIADLDAQLMKFATNSMKLSEIMAEKDRVEIELAEKMDRWVYLNDLKEQIDAQGSASVD